MELNSLMFYCCNDSMEKDTKKLVAGFCEVREQCGEVCGDVFVDVLLLCCCCAVVLCAKRCERCVCIALSPTDK